MSIASLTFSPMRVMLRARAIGAEALLAPAAALAAFVVYMLTLAPTVYGFDSAELATGAYSLGIVHATGYPLYLLLGKLFTLLPIGDVAYRVNLLSAAFGAGTVGLLVAVARRLGCRPLTAVAAAGLFAFSNYFWQMAVVAEVYTLHTFGLALSLWALLAWHHDGRAGYLQLFTFVYALSLGNHMSGVLFAPAFAGYLLLHPRQPLRSLQTVATMGLLAALGLSVYLYLPLRSAAQPPIDYVGDYYGVDLASPSGILWMMSGQMYRFFVFGHPAGQILREAAAAFGFLWRNFLGAGVLIGAVGAVAQFKHSRRSFGLCAGIYLAVTMFFINYAVVDKDTMFLPAYLMWALWVGLGLEALARLAGHLDKFGVDVERVRAWVLRGGLALAAVALLTNWQWVDRSQNHAARVFAEDVFASAEPGAMVMGHWSSTVILEYYQVVEGERPDLTLFNRSRWEVARYYQLWERGLPPEQIFATLRQEQMARLEAESRQHSVYIIEYGPLFAGDYVYRPVGDYYRLERRSG